MNSTEMEVEYMATPYEVERIKKQGSNISGFVVMENFFIPMVDDLERLNNFIEDCKTVTDIGSGYGLLISSLAKSSNNNFLGIDTLYWKQNTFPIPEELNNLKFEFNGIEAMTSNRNKKIRKFDCVICSWMPQGSDWRKMLSRISNKKVILILSTNFVTGTIETYTGMEKFGFRLKGRAWTSKDSLIQLWEKNQKEVNTNGRRRK